MALSGRDPGGPCACSKAPPYAKSGTEDEEAGPGLRVEVEWEGKWFPATVYGGRVAGGDCLTVDQVKVVYVSPVL